MEMLRSVSDTAQKQNKSCVVVLAAAQPGKLVFLVTVTQDLVGQGYSAKKIAEVFTGVVGGRGGGRDNKVEGGGKDPTKIDEAFVTSFSRSVKGHNSISIDGDLWEIPLGHRDCKKIQVFRNMITGQLAVLHKGKRTPIKQADLTANAYERRSAPAAAMRRLQPRRTAADAAWERDHPPLVDDDGNYNEGV